MIASVPLRKALAIALALIVSLCAWTIFVAPVLDAIEADQARLVQSRQLLARYDLLASQLPALEARLQSLTSSGDGTGFLLGDSPAVVTAELQTKVRALLDAAGVTVRNSQTALPRDDSGFTRFTLQLDLTASPASLERLLHALETATPVIFVEKLSIRVPETSNPRPDPDPQMAMIVHMDVSGYRPTVKS